MHARQLVAATIAAACVGVRRWLAATVAAAKWWVAKAGGSYQPAAAFILFNAPFWSTLVRRALSSRLRYTQSCESSSTNRDFHQSRSASMAPLKDLALSHRIYGVDTHDMCRWPQRSFLGWSFEILGSFTLVLPNLSLSPDHE
ncbi:hypothetical protein Tco_0392801 [Tanacetum coccineum]